MCSKSSKVQDKELLPLFVGHLPEFAIQILKDELNESQERKGKDIKELRSLLQSSEKTREIDFHEDCLVQYLRRNKYRIQDTYQHIHNFVNLSIKESSLLRAIPDHYFETVSSHFMLLLPKRCPEGSAVIIYRIGRWSSKEFPFECFSQLAMVLLLQLLRDPMNQINGFKFIHDFQDTFSTLKYCTPRNLYLLYNVTVNCIPARYKEIHIVNESLAMKTIWAFIKHFLSQKIKDRMFFHSKPTDLLDHFPSSILPAEYGGTLQDDTMHEWIQKANKEHESYSIEGLPNFDSF